MELLAPAGTIQSLRAAVVAGADAVYFGLGELNARAKSLDFNESNAKEWIDYCHLYGVKVYITINVNVYDSELEKALYLVSVAYKAKADAVIVSDLGLITLIRKRYPDLCVHVSTQAGIKNYLASDFYKELGVTRVVLAREASLSDISKISGVEKEVFAHGALCVSFSGNCLLSCYVGGKSGNRGQCRQPCRQLYSVTDESGRKLFEGYALSTKDVCLADYLSQLSSAGVDCLKIEGRLKSPEYVFAVTTYYRQLLDRLKPDKKDVLISFNRGSFAPAYFKGKNVIYTKTSSHIGLPIGKVLKVENKNGFYFATVDCELEKGDGLKILREGYEVGGSDVTSCVKSGNNFVIPVSKGIKPNDDLRLTRSAELSKKVLYKTRKLAVDFFLKFGENAVLSAKHDGIEVEAEGEKPADIRNMSYDEVCSQLSKTGNTSFELRSLIFEGNGYLPKSRLNALRNEVLDKLKKAIVDNYAVSPCRNSYSAVDRSNKDRINGVIVESDNLNIEVEFDALVYYPKIVCSEEYAKAVEYCKNKSKRLFIKFPFLIGVDEQKEYYLFAKKNGVGVYADNVSVVQAARNYSIPYIAGIGLNIANEITVTAFSDATAIVSSVELGRNGVDKNCFVYSYGRIPLMHFEHCPNEVVSGKNCDSCQNPTRTLYYNHVNSFKLIGRKTKYRCYYTMYSDKIIDYGVRKNAFVCLIDSDERLSKCDEIIGE